MFLPEEEEEAVKEIPEAPEPVEPPQIEEDKEQDTKTEELEELERRKQEKEDAALRKRYPATQTLEAEDQTVERIRTSTSPELKLEITPSNEMEGGKREWKVKIPLPVGFLVTIVREQQEDAMSGSMMGEFKYSVGDLRSAGKTGAAAAVVAPTLTPTQQAVLKSMRAQSGRAVEGSLQFWLVSDI